MKALFTAAIALLALTATSQTLFDADTNTVAAIDNTTGVLTDGNNDQIGIFTMNGNTITVNDANNALIGTIDNGTVKDANNDVIGTVLANGTVEDSNGDVLGKINANNTVEDMNGNIIGSCSASGDTNCLAWFYFFQQGGTM